ncbi:MAG: UDP-3-O-(3-hydroxymyristoyl)glucosamine N-acyltransferase [Pseudazoarcus pumilus]|nr:UDP-3-O-(3-hydroxymyristoyl)glucosamine N-acyltransferase [Pseudazoarcus pumilus]
MYTLDQIVARFGGEVVGDGSTLIEQVGTLDQAARGCISFLANPKYASQLAACQASAVIVAPAARERTTLPRIVAADPYVYFARVSQLLNPARRPDPGVGAAAVIASQLPASVSIGAGASIGVDVVLGEGVVIGPGCHVGDGVHIGEGTVLNANVTIYHACVLGARCIVHSGTVVGADGFGFARERDGSWVKIPQIGRVVIGDDVEIGANTTIDRGALEDTVIGNDVKLDNQIQIAHNVRIGDHTAIAGCVGIAGSTTIGARCMIGGQAGVIGHLEICDDVVISAGTLVTKSIRERGVYTGNLPLQQHGDWVRNFAHLRHLDSLADRIRRLEQLLTERSGA